MNAENEAAPAATGASLNNGPTDSGTSRISRFSSERAKEPRGENVTWNELVALLSNASQAACTQSTCGRDQFARDGKQDQCVCKYGPAWSPAVYRPGETRSIKNVGVVSLLVLDLDDLTDEELSEALRRLKPYRYAAHTSHSDRLRDNKRCWRVVLALSEPVPTADWPRFWSTAMTELGQPADPACCDASRLYFLPVSRADAEHVCTSNLGKPIDVRAILAKAPPRTPVRQLSDVGDLPPASPELLERCKQRLRDHGPAIEGQGGDRWTFSACAALVHGYALTEAEAWPLLREWNATCEPPWDEEDLRQKIANATAYASGPRGGERLEWEATTSLGRRLLAGPAARAAEAASRGPVAVEYEELDWGIEDDAEPVSSEAMFDHAAGLLALQTAMRGEMGGSAMTRRYGGSLRGFLGEDDPGEDPNAWLIRGFLPAGVPSVLAGHPKSIKTWLMELGAICVASGRPLPFLHDAPVKRGRVLVLALEDTARETSRRIWRIARGLGLDPRELEGWLEVEGKAGFRFDKPDDIAAMRATIEGFGPSLVMIDSLSRTHAGDENSKSELMIVTSTWGELCREYGLAFVMIHHFTKSGQGSLLQRIRGSGDIGALVRHIIGVEKREDPSPTSRAAELSFEGNLNPLPAPLR